MKSMTGYGRAEFQGEDFNLDIEIKSVNSRFLDLKIYLNRELSSYENEINKTIGESIKRGKVEVRVNLNDLRKPDIELNEKNLHLYAQLYNKAKKILQLKQEIPLANIMKEKDILVIKDKRMESVIEALKKTLVKAIKEHEKIAVQEGKSMGKFILASVKKCDKALDKIKESFPEYRQKEFSRLKNSIEELIKGKIDQEMMKSIVLEAALYNDRSDITEEIVRLEDHIKRVNATVGEDTTAKGKKLNFIIQEMQREANTIGSKFNYSRTFKYVLLIKEEIEKMREIVQNVE